MHDVFFGALVIVHRRSSQRGNFVLAQGTHDFCRIAEDERVVRDFFVLRDDRARADNAVVTDLRVAQNYRAHAD